MKNIAFICADISGSSNTTPMQRSLFLCKNYDVYFLTIHVCPESIKEKSKAIFKCPGRKFFLSHLIFPFWVLFILFRLKKKIKIHCIYTTYFPLALISGFLAKNFLAALIYFSYSLLSS